MLRSLPGTFPRRSTLSTGRLRQIKRFAAIATKHPRLSTYYTESSPTPEPSISSQIEDPSKKPGPFVHDYARARFISTLNPSRLIASDYQTISGAAYVALCPPTLWPHNPSSELCRKSDDGMYVKLDHTLYEKPYVSFVTYKSDLDIPFPSETSGFFYYHQPTAAPPASGQIRFRITRNRNPASWGSGMDLYLPNGLVWKKSLLEVTGKHPKLTALRTLLLADKLISPELVERCETIWSWRGELGPNIFLYQPEQVFWTAFSAFDRGQFVVVGREEQKYVRVRSFFRDLRSQPLNPYSGSALCRFEFYDPPPSRTRRRNMRKAAQSDRPLPRKLVLRIIQIIDPVSCTVPDYDGFVNEPKAGKLMMLGVGDSRRPWMYDVDTGEEAPARKTGELVAPEQLREELEGFKLLLDYRSVG